jgi:hypothetical protein
MSGGASTVWVSPLTLSVVIFFSGVPCQDVCAGIQIVFFDRLGDVGHLIDAFYREGTRRDFLRFVRYYIDKKKNTETVQ